jgi:serine/threonine protein kinase
MTSVAGYPRRFGSYLLLKPLARGGMGELDLAVAGERGMEKLCVIKKVLPHLLLGENVQRFRDEVMVMVRLSHGNLVGVLDAGTEEGQSYLAMDFVEGKDLLATWNRCATKRVAFPVEIAAYIVKELARGLAYAHGFRDLNLVHRDISPANVLLSYSGEVRLTDFGLATSKLKEQRTAPGIIFGKMAYLAPEQARGEPLDQRTDLYSAGILLWEMLTGQQLFPTRPPTDLAPRGRESTIAALERVKHPKIELPSMVTSRVPPELDEIVMRALAPDPAHRYPNGEALRADLASFLAETAPETDAATLASFMTVLFEDQIASERLERDALLARARAREVPPSATMAVTETMIDATSADGAPSARAEPPGAFALAPGGLLAPAKESPPTEAPGASLVEAPAGAPAPDGSPSSSDPQAEPWWLRSADRDTRVGTTIGGRYFLRRLCGEGAMGRVYEGHHVEIGRRVAVKILHASFSQTPDVVERFRREARAASRIGHPNIVDVTDSGVTADGSLFFVMDYLDGLNLEQTIAREGPLSVERALLIAAQVSRAIVAAHSVGIVHRDLKPANVMLGTQRDGEDFVKVLDFGISKQSAREGESRKEAGLTRPDAAVGTPIYMAPEQISGLPADARTDVYALGELLYEMLTGVPPYDGSDVMVVFNRKANQEPKPILTLRPDLGPAIDRMIRRAMARRPEDRHQSMTELKEDILACLKSRDATAIPPRPLSMEKTVAAPRPGRIGTRTLWITIAGAIVGLGSAAAVVLDGVGPSSRAWMSRGHRTAPAIVASGAAEASRGPVGGIPPSMRTTPVLLPTPRSPPGESPPRAVPEPRSTSADVVVASAVASAGSTTPSSRPPATPARTTTRPARSAHPGRASAGGGPPLTSRPGASEAAAPTAAAPEAAPAAATLSSDGWLTVGREAFAKGRFPESVRAARASLAGGSSAEAHLLLGDTYFKMERFADAVREFEAALALAPDNAHARRGRDLATTRLARAAGPAQMQRSSSQSTP